MGTKQRLPWTLDVSERNPRDQQQTRRAPRGRAVCREVEPCPWWLAEGSARERFREQLCLKKAPTHLTVDDFWTESTRVEPDNPLERLSGEGTDIGVVVDQSDVEEVLYQ